MNGLGHYYGSGGAGDVLWLYDFNTASQIRSVSRDNDSYAWTGHYAVARAYTTNGLNQYTAAGSASFGYDANGNLTGDGSKTYVYDIENRLISASTGVTLSYDPLGRLYQVTASGGATTRFLYDGDALVAEYNAAGEMTHRYVHWDGADVPIMSYDGPTLTSPRYLHADHQGSIVAISTASGAGQINRYDEYGIPAATNAGRFQYTGQIWLAELGMYYYKARLYSPTLGRFLQVDPIGYDDQFNLYEYVGDDPVNHSDPTGLDGSNDHFTDVLRGRAPPAVTPEEGAAGAAVLGKAAAVFGVGRIAGPRIAGFVGRYMFRGNGVGTRGTSTTVNEAEAGRRAAASGTPRPGSRGAPDHQADVQGPGRRQAEAQARPGERVATEEAVEGHPGLNRRPDNQIIGTDGRTRLVVESERRPNGSYHREREADYQRCGIRCQTRILSRQGD